MRECAAAGGGAHANFYAVDDDPSTYALVWSYFTSFAASEPSEHD